MADPDRAERVSALDSLGPESRLARDERQAGIVIDDLACPLLIVTGTADTQWPRRRYDDFPFPADHVSVEGASHWGLVLNRRGVPGLVSAVFSWVGGNASPGRTCKNCLTTCQSCRRRGPVISHLRWFAA